MVDTGNELDDIALGLLEADGLLDSRLRILRWLDDDLDALAGEDVRGAFDIVRMRHLEGEVVQARFLAGMERKHVMLRTVSTEKQLLAVLVDRLEAPARRVELGLLAQISRAQANVREPPDFNPTGGGHTPSPERGRGRRHRFPDAIRQEAPALAHTPPPHQTRPQAHPPAAGDCPLPPAHLPRRAATGWP